MHAKELHGAADFLVVFAQSTYVTLGSVILAACSWTRQKKFGARRALTVEQKGWSKAGTFLRT